MIGLIGIILSLVLLMYLAYRGITVLVLAPFLACLAVLFAGDLPLLATYTQVFMNAAGRFVMTYFPLFLLGALFGKLMDDSGPDHRSLDRREAGGGTFNPGGRTGLRHPDLWRRLAVRRGLRCLSHRGRPVP
jgi:hypothetical protein